MNIQKLDHGDTLECYGVEFEVVLILGTSITIRNTQPDKRGKYNAVTTTTDIVLSQIENGHYKLKKKEVINTKK